MEGKIKVKDLPLDDRPREKLELRGPRALTDAELLAIILRTGKKSKSALEVAAEIINEYKSLRELAKRNHHEILEAFKGEGIGKTKAITLLAAIELGRRTTQLDINNEEIQVTEPRVIFDLMNPKLSHLTVEEFHIVLLNRKNVILKTELVTRGTLDSSLVSPREVFKIAIDNRASSIILVHNHPSGNLEPSREDIKVTEQFFEAGKILEIPVLDHIIIANNYYTSFLERNLVFK
ncbi:MAG: DNA repair protein RadC [Ignavibacteria bacterium]|nr:DNA repair protein RadC [Ignavibacteria bacterium]